MRIFWAMNVFMNESIRGSSFPSLEIGNVYPEYGRLADLRHENDPYVLASKILTR